MQWVMWALVLSLLSSLVLSPMLSRMHQVVHRGHGVAAMAMGVTIAVATAPSEVDTGQTPEPSADRSQLNRLFGQHTDGTQVCQLLDQGHASDGAAPQDAGVFVALVAFTRARPVLAAPASCNVAFFEARGPPTFL